ncbi:MAG: sulfite exporter TauE/SafE family protein [Ideonella sp.]
MGDSVVSAIFIGLIFLAAGLVKGVVGLGLPTVAIGLLSLTMPPAAAAALLIAPSLATNVWQSCVGEHFWALLKRLWPLLATIVLGTLLSIGVLTGSSAGLANAALGSVLIVYGAFGLKGRRFDVSRALERWLSPLMGILTGLIAGTTGVFVMPLIPYLNSLGFDKNELVQALGLAFTVSTVGLAAGLAMSGNFQLAAASASLLAVLPALVGMWIGQRLRGRIAGPAFKRWFFSGLIGLGIYMLGRGLLSR